MVAIAIVCGVFTGFIGFVPLYFGLRIRKKMIAAPVAVSTLMLLSCMFVSGILLVLLSVAYLRYQPSGALPFACAAAVALSAIAIGYGLCKNQGNAKKE